MHAGLFAKRIGRTSSVAFAFLICACLASLFPVPDANRVVHSQANQDQNIKNIPVIAAGSAYRQTNLVSDSPGLASVLDPLLVNPWGISMTASSPFWVANAGSDTSTLYRGDVGGSPLVKNPGLAAITIPGQLPTGTVANPTASDFVLPGPCAAAPCGANFLFASLTGNIVGWDPNAPAAGSTTGVIAAHPPNVGPIPNVYTGLAIGNNGVANFLYAANLSVGRVDVFNNAFALQPAASFPFTDPTAGAEALPADYHPHNIQALSGELYVTYARMNPAPPDPTNPYVRPGGVVNVFDFNGNFLRRIHFSDPMDTNTEDPLSAPWGLAIAPGTFGIFSNALLVGNFDFDGNGRISAFNKTTGAFLGQFQNEAGELISIDGLWGLTFGNGGNGGDPNTLYFAAGIGHEQHGLFGKLNPTTAPATSLIQFATDDFAINESAGHIDITVTRAGDASGTATVNFNTFDETAPSGRATQKSDYEIALGTLSFAPGETSKTFRVLLVDDESVEGSEVIDLFLSNPTGAGLGLGSPTKAQLTILEDDVVAPVANAIDDPSFFVRQHYLDFLNREPDANAAALTSQITACGGDTACIETKRANISTGFFQSIEFQNTGYLAYLAHRAAFGPNPSASPADILYGNFERDLQALQRGFVFGQPGADAVLEANKVAYFNEFVTRPEFVAKYPSTLTNAQFVDALLASADLEPLDVRLFVVPMTNNQEVPPAVPTLTTGAPRPASFGTARLQFNQAQTALSLNATISNIDITGLQSTDTNDNLTAAHIHAGPTVGPGVNGSVVWGFFGTPFNDNNPNDQVFFANPGIGGTFSGKWDAPEGNGTTLAAQLSNVREGRAYINFHTRQFGGGEIRGNFPAADAFRNQLVAGLDGATLTRALVLRAVAESEELNTRELNRASVAMAFFGYLRRDADASAFNFLLNRVNSLGDISRANLVRIFLKAPEYRQRFGPDSVPFVNNAPVASSDVAATSAVTPIAIDVLANDTDPDGDFLTVTSVVAGTGGTPTISANGRSVIFRPSPGFAGIASFQYTTSDNGFSCPGPGACTPETFTYNSMSSMANVTVTVNAAGIFQLGASSVSVGEGTGKVTLTVTLTGGTATPVTVDYATAPSTGGNCATVSGVASERCDFVTAVGTLRFAPGETSKTVDVFMIDDAYVEGPETFTFSLSNPTGGPTFTLGVPATETVTITDNDAAAGPNPIDTPAFFVRQQYLDFLVREPEAAGLAFYLEILGRCAPGDVECRNFTRGVVAANFLRSPEFQRKGLFVVYLYMVSLGQRPATVAELSDPSKIERPHYTEFIADLQSISDPADDPAIVTAKKDALTVAWLQRAEIQARYGSLTNAQFVQKLSDTSGVTVSNQAQLVTNLDNASMTRAQVLRAFVESPEVNTKFFKQAFVTMQYFGFLRRDPEVCVGSPNPSQCGYIFHNARFQLSADQAFLENIMVRGFIESPEYRSRFGSP